MHPFAWLQLSKTWIALSDELLANLVGLKSLKLVKVNCILIVSGCFDSLCTLVARL